MKKDSKVVMFTNFGIFAALTFVLDFVQGLYSKSIWINGGSLGIALCGIFILSFRYGLWSIIPAFVVGILNMLQGLYISPLANTWYQAFIQIGLDYFIAWGVVGFAGLFFKQVREAKSVKTRSMYIAFGVLLGGVLKFFSHFLAGMLYWPNSDYKSQFLYSFLYNGSYMLPSIIVCIVLMIIIINKQPMLIGIEEEKNNEE